MIATNNYHLLAKAFIQEDTQHCFALLGDANMYWATAMANLGCEFTYVRDEHCAVAAAMAWSRTTGKPGVASVTCGPGLTQILTALPAAVRADIPLVIFAGESPMSKAWYNQDIEQRPFVEACGATYVSLHHPKTMATQVRDAFLHARISNQPVVLGVPLDLQELVAEPDTHWPERSLAMMPKIAATPPNPIDIKNAVDLINAANRIVIMAGRGAVAALALTACRALAERVDALLATTLPARGAFHNNPFCIGIAGGFSTDTARRCLQEADLVIAIGCSLAQHNSDNGRLFSADKVLHVDTQPLSYSQGRAAAKHHLRSDARLGVEAILTEVDEKSPIDPWRTETLADEIANIPADGATFDITEGFHDPRDVVSALEAALPDDWQLVNSSGHCSYFFAQMPSRPADRFLTIREFGAIGNGIAFAIGVAAAHPDKRVVLFDGDGSLLMHIQELETIRRHKLNILICVLNDGAYGSEIHKLRAEGLGEQGAVFGHTDLGSIARGFGVQGEIVEDLQSIDAMALSLGKDSGAAVWDFHVSDQVVSPVIRRSHQTASR